MKKINCNKFEILAKESGANFHNISNTRRNGIALMKFVSSAPKAEQERAVNWLRSVLEGQEGSGVLSWGMRGTSQGEMSVMIKDNQLDYCYNWLLERALFTESELELITNMYGYDINTLDLAVYERFGYQTVQDLIDEE